VTDRAPWSEGRAQPKTAAGKISDAIDLQPVLVVFCALLLAVIVGGVLIIITGGNPLEAYWALLYGIFGSWDSIAGAIARSTPFIGTALAVAFAFKAGLFNIGVEGQLLFGGMVAAWAGTWSWLVDVPGPLAVPIVLGAGVAGGMLWGGIPGVLRARTGAHEVITTIMLNSIALFLVRWLVNSQDPIYLRDPTSSVPRTRPVAENARLPELVDSVPRLSVATLIMLALCVVVWFVLQRTTFGFEVRTMGANPAAAHYAGVSVGLIVVLVMALSGGIAGLTAAGEVAGTYYFYQPGLFTAIGFDGIAIALLARANPFAIIPAAFLWGSMLYGASYMQLEAGVSIDVVRIVLSLVLLFVAADAIVRYVFRLKKVQRGVLAVPATTGGKLA
jgi:simple sugar transport system permease protein